ncbi:hypothetical protein ACFFLE_06390 [Salinicoccus siamensis]|uniref:Uncharacterized protein n=1 Tax=Salinicoccus siamensis TaxID=381830 RepID=A0ABV5Z3Q7_9STAP
MKLYQSCITTTRVIWTKDDLFELYYPTSKISDTPDGRTITEWEAAVKPDVDIPWSPRHITEDPDLEAALVFIDGSR